MVWAKNTGVNVFRLAHARDGQLAALEAADVFGVPLRADQFVVAAPHEIQQVVEKLADIRRPHKVIQAQFANAFAEVDPEVLVVKHSELLAAAGQQFVAIGVKGSNLQTGGVRPAEFGFNPLPHLPGRIFGVSDGEDLVGANPGIANQAGNASDEDGGFARARPCDHQHGPVDMLDSLALAVIEFECGCGGPGL